MQRWLHQHLRPAPENPVALKRGHCCIVLGILIWGRKCGKVVTWFSGTEGFGALSYSTEFQQAVCVS